MKIAKQQLLLPFLGAVLLISVVQISTVPVLSWTPPLSTSSQSTSRNQQQSGQHQLQHHEDAIASPFKDQQQSRRGLFQNAASVAVAAMMATTTTSLLVGHPNVANAAGVPSASDLERLRKGHARVQYMLQNWGEITQICKNNSDQAMKQVVRTDGGDKCEKTPLNVQIYMGYKSTEDPLYKADKLMIRAVPLVKAEFDEADYLEAVENFREKADNTAMMAYTSSWGEANPNGGKDAIDDYLEKTRLDVVSSEQSLRQVLKYLGLEVLPPSKNP